MLMDFVRQPGCIVYFPFFSQLGPQDPRIPNPSIGYIDSHLLTPQKFGATTAMSFNLLDSKYRNAHCTLHIELWSQLNVRQMRFF